RNLGNGPKKFHFWSGLFPYAEKIAPRKNQSCFTLDLLPLDFKENTHYTNCSLFPIMEFIGCL
ncbi:hypothetical protein ACT453_61235, partial [Bacillus sp. D-CC]